MTQKRQPEVETKIFDAFLKLVLGIGEVAYYGLGEIKVKSVNFVLVFFSLTMLSFTLIYAKLIYFNKDYFFNFLFLLALMCFLNLLALGICPFLKIKKYQRDLDEIGLKTARGNRPKVLKCISLDAYKTKLVVKSKGIGAERFELRRNDLTSSFEQLVESIKTSNDQKSIEIILTKKALTREVRFFDLIEKLQTPYQILVGESMEEIVVDDIREAPHYLVCGSTGGGKSVFFNNALLSLAKSCLNGKGKAAIQFYLIDLKRGVEVKPFSDWPNVKVAKTEEEALQFLQMIKAEMDRRFLFMEEKGIKKIEPARDKKDIVILGIDEASVIFGKTKNKPKMATVNKCRDIFDEICKLARASGIHLIVATQKPVSESIDTKSLENLNGRVVFKMSTHAGSMTALGNSLAYKLPDIKGRCIWKGGNRFLEIQAPFISEKEIEEECRNLAQEFAKEENGNFQEMLKTAPKPQRKDKVLKGRIREKKKISHNGKG